MRKFVIFILFAIGAAFAIQIASCVNDAPTTPEENALHQDTTKTEQPQNEWFCKTIAVKDQDTRRAVISKGKNWPVGAVLKVGFFGGNATQKAAVKQYAAEWSKYANIKFDFESFGPYDIRVAFNPNGGAWSYVGTDCKFIPLAEPTMNLGWMGQDVVQHEFGHALGLNHEHQNPNGGICWNEANVLKDLSGPPNNWSEQVIRHNVLNRLDVDQVETSPWDALSIMHYNIPATWVCSGVEIQGGRTISQQDQYFIAMQYPGIVVEEGITLTAAQVKEIESAINANESNALRHYNTVKKGNAAIKKTLQIKK